MFELGESLESVAAGTVVLLGIPSDERSSFLRGAADAPARIRHLMLSGAGNMYAEDGTDLRSGGKFVDLGDLDLGAVAEMESTIEKAVAAVLDRGGKVLALGGDHAVTQPILRAYSKKHRGLAVLHFDAHPDLYDEYEGFRGSHACTFARVMEEQLVERLVQVGVRASTPEQRAQAERFGVHTIGARELSEKWPVSFDGPVYVTVDMDVLDPSCAPGVAHPEAGGLTTREVLGAIQGLSAPVVGADIVEFNPGRDSSDITAAAAVKLLKELAAAMLRE